jgi:hypothetical protein
VPPVKYVSASEIRTIFRDGRFEDLVAYGVLSEKLIWEGPASIQANQSPGTKSQIVAYVDEHGKQAALVHQYVKPDGTLGASGKPDPKKVLVNGTLYAMDPSL